MLTESQLKYTTDSKIYPLDGAPPTTDILRTMMREELCYMLHIAETGPTGHWALTDC